MHGRIFVPVLVGPPAGALLFAVELPDFGVLAAPVSVAQDSRTKLDFTLKQRRWPMTMPRPSEIVAALPGTDHQKVLLMHCSNCHSLQWALQLPPQQEDWAVIVKRMGGRASKPLTWHLWAFRPKAEYRSLAEYLAQSGPV